MDHDPIRQRQAEVADVLVVQHTADCPPARVARWLEAAGCRLDVRRCYDGDPLPARPHRSRRVAGPLPTLAICLGLQLLAVAEGGSVAPAVAGPQVGLQPVSPTAAAADDPLFGALRQAPAGTLLAAHWNNDVVTAAPPGAIPLAVTDAGPQAFRLGHHVWAAADVAAGLLDPELAEDRLAAVAAADDGLVRSWRGVTERFADVVSTRAARLA